MTPRANDPVVARLSKADRRTYEALFRHPAPEDLEWGAVRALLGALAEVQEGRKGSFKATRRGVMATFVAPRDREPLSADERIEVRHFLERSGEGVSTPVVDEATPLLVAIDAEAARLYRIELRASVPRRLEPFHGNGYPAELRTSHASLDGTRQPVRLGFYKDLVRALHGAERVLLVACGEGGASAMEALRVELARSHPEVARRVVGALALEDERPAEARLLARTRAFFAELP